MAKPIVKINISLHLTILMVFKILYLNTHHSLLNFCRAFLYQNHYRYSKSLLRRRGSIIV